MCILADIKGYGMFKGYPMWDRVVGCEVPERAWCPTPQNLIASVRSLVFT